ncbi:MAG: prepilin-type N-terminal cleavage/methylation domain-containing protein [Candidatus Paceibacterota bacterium]|jgi:prepilin-type N-terminal cleavage/methylation domain-containing protein
MTALHSARGFTLIELLVVISIIGVLSSVVLASLNTARYKANDAARIANVKALKTALQMYYIDNGIYPQPPNADVGHLLTDLSSYLVPTYIGSIPANLVADSDRYVWASSNSGIYGLHIKTQTMYATNPVNPYWCNTGVAPDTSLRSWWATGGPPAPQQLICSF